MTRLPRGIRAVGLSVAVLSLGLTGCGTPESAAPPPTSYGTEVPRVAGPSAAPTATSSPTTSAPTQPGVATVPESGSALGNTDLGLPSQPLNGISGAFEEVAATSSAPAPKATTGNIGARAPEQFMRGQDFSWPQCPAGMGRGEGKPIPGKTVPGLRFAVIGVNQGSPFNANPCLASQVAWAKANHLAVAAYTLPAPPTPAELRKYGSMRAFGKAQASWTANQIRSVGFDPNFMWLDVEPLILRKWGRTAADQANARAIIAGMQEGFSAASIRTGFYSYKTGWNEITGGLRSNAPVWFTTARTDWGTAAQGCGRPSWSGGPVVLSQWYDGTMDFNVTCPAMASNGGFGAFFVQY